MELEALAEMNFDIHLLGFDDDFLRKLLIEENGGLTDPDDAPDLDESWVVTRDGDVWLLGKHRLMCGDATCLSVLERLCEGQLVDMWLTDPPYNVGYVGKTAATMTIRNDAMSGEAFRVFLRDAYIASDASMKPCPVFYIWHADRGRASV